jgi:hypothetical protein
MVSMSSSSGALDKPSSYVLEHILSTRLDVFVALCFAGTLAAAVYR